MKLKTECVCLHMQVASGRMDECGSQIRTPNDSAVSCFVTAKQTSRPKSKLGCKSWVMGKKG